MDNKKIARELVRLARDIMGTEFDSQEAMDKYLKEHPGADKSNHSVKKKEKTESGTKGKDDFHKSNKFKDTISKLNISTKSTIPDEHLKKLFDGHSDADLAKIKKDTHDKVVNENYDAVKEENLSGKRGPAHDERRHLDILTDAVSDEIGRRKKEK